MCGIVGLVNHSQPVASDLYIGLVQMQHRGKEGAGLATCDSNRYYEEKGAGELAQAFIIPSSEQARQKLARMLTEPRSENEWAHVLPPTSISSMPGSAGIGHTRYGTAGRRTLDNVQPISGLFRGELFYLAHNGNLVNSRYLRSAGTKDGCSDTAVVADLLSRSQAASFEQALVETVQQLEGAFNLVLLYRGLVYAVRDRFGFHPLTLGQREHDQGSDLVVASETAALDTLGAYPVREVAPGEIVCLERGGRVVSQRFTDAVNLRLDIFEYIYFLRPDSVWYGVEAGAARYLMGRNLARQHSITGNVVMPIADSGNEAALGFWEGLRAKGCDVEFRPWGLFRSHFVSRTFIEPVQEQRQRYLKLKFSPRRSQVKNRDVVLVDDSIVRGNTIGMAYRLLKEAGAGSISLVVSSPPYRYPDFYGIDTYRVRNELLAKVLGGDDSEVAQKIAEHFGLHQVGYLSLEQTLSAVVEASGGSLSHSNFYLGPFTGEYPAGVGDFADALK